MAYVAMNTLDRDEVVARAFLNGVCRHEHSYKNEHSIQHFLNGVCRHELANYSYDGFPFFLNGVCRHELSV